MASRTKQKEEARSRRLAEEHARAERALRDRRLRMLGGVGLAAVAIVAVAIAVSSGGTSSAQTGLQSGQAATKTATGVQSLLAGIPQSGARLGSPTAPIKLTYWGDLECPTCQAFTLLGGFPQLVQSDVRSGKVQVTYRAFQTATRDPATFNTQQVAALAAGQQGRFWNFVELFYHEQGQEGTGYVTESYFNGLAKQITGLNLNQWQRARNNAAFAGSVAADMQTGRSIGVAGTPTLVFQGPKGKQVAASAAVPTYAQLEQAIKQVS